MNKTEIYVSNIVEAIHALYEEGQEAVTFFEAAGRAALNDPEYMKRRNGFIGRALRLIDPDRTYAPADGSYPPAQHTQAVIEALRDHPLIDKSVPENSLVPLYQPAHVDPHYARLAA